MRRYYGYQGHKFVKQVRKKLKLKQDELAYLLSISEDAVYKWEQGTSRPSREHMEALCRLLYVKPEKKKHVRTERRKGKHVDWRHELMLQWNPRMRRRVTDWRHELEFNWRKNCGNCEQRR